jgi:hypothetical protein
MDLDDLIPEDKPAPLTLTHPGTGLELTHEGKKLVIYVNGPDSQVMRDHERASQNRRLKVAQNTGRLALDAATIEAELNIRVAKAIAGWENIVISGIEITYSEGEALDLITKRTWIRDQVDAFYQNRSNFFRKPSRIN